MGHWFSRSISLVTGATGPLTNVVITQLLVEHVWKHDPQSTKKCLPFGVGSFQDDPFGGPFEPEKNPKTTLRSLEVLEHFIDSSVYFSSHQGGNLTACKLHHPVMPHSQPVDTEPAALASCPPNGWEVCPALG